MNRQLAIFCMILLSAACFHLGRRIGYQEAQPEHVVFLDQTRFRAEFWIQANSMTAKSMASGVVNDFCYLLKDALSRSEGQDINDLKVFAFVLREVAKERVENAEKNLHKPKRHQPTPEIVNY